MKAFMKRVLGPASVGGRRSRPAIAEGGHSDVSCHALLLRRLPLADHPEVIARPDEELTIGDRDGAQAVRAAALIAKPVRRNQFEFRTCPEDRRHAVVLRQ